MRKRTLTVNLGNEYNPDSLVHEVSDGLLTPPIHEQPDRGRNNEHNTDEIRAPENYNSATKYTSTGGKTTVSGGEVTCTIDKVVMQGPAKSSNAEFEIL